MDKKKLCSYVIVFVLGCLFTGAISFSGARLTRQQLEQVRAERDRATERYKEFEFTVKQLSDVKSEYDRLYLDIRESTGRIQNLTGNNLEIIRGCHEIITQIRDSMQSFEDNTGSINSGGFNNRSSDNLQTDGVIANNERL